MAFFTNVCQPFLTEFVQIVNDVGIAAPQQRIRERLWQKVFASDDPYHLIVVIDDTQEAQTKRAKQAVGSLDRRCFVDCVRSGVGVRSQIQPAVSIWFSH